MRCVVVVAGALGRLPFEVLPTADGRLFGDIAPISYLPSAATLVELRSGTGRPLPVATGDFLGVAPEYTEDPLPAAQRELSTAATGFAGADLRRGAAATPAAIVAAVAHFRHVHFACHGYVDEEQPEQSGLVLAADDAEDAEQVLHLHALLDVELAADVVVASGCATGPGRLRAGEGMVGFGTAFLAAGAGHLIASLWKVGDKPSERLMAAFYERLRQGTAPVEALWRAKQHVRGIYGDPVAWAGFIAIGPPDR
jgi:CHAT domain-containing protein